jgi:hypothetical protein
VAPDSLAEGRFAKHSPGMTSKPNLTKLERSIRECMLNNSAGEVAYRHERYWQAVNDGLSKGIQQRRHREMLRACEALIEVGTSRLPDTYLRYSHGEVAVRERDKLLGVGADVVPIKRSGRPL